MTFLSGTPLECTVHPSLWGNIAADDDFDDNDEDPDNIIDQVKVENNATDVVGSMKCFLIIFMRE